MSSLANPLAPFNNSMNTSNNRYGSEALNQQFAAYNPFADGGSQRLGHRYVPNAAAARGAPYNANSNNNAGGGYGSFNPTHAQQVTTTTPEHCMGRPYVGTEGQLVTSAFSASTPSTNNGRGFDPNLSKAQNLARFVMMGATEDPRDPDYGNPGRSVKLSREEPTGVPKAQPLMGKIAPGYEKVEPPPKGAPSHINGNAAVYLGKDRVDAPGWLNQAGNSFMPKVEQVLAALPAIEACRAARPSTAGIIKIGNIPYATSRAEIVAFLGKNSRILMQPASSTTFYAVHIMMDKQTAKTMDAFVEVKDTGEALLVMRQFDRRTRTGGHIKLGDRDVTLVAVSQAEFMATLFPRAKNVEWRGPIPVISRARDEYYQGKFSTGFQGFLQVDELHMIKKHAEQTERSPFAARVPIRTYEALITTIHKYPWYMVDYVLLKERDLIYETTWRVIRGLIDFLDHKTDKFASDPKVHPTESTLQELVVAALTCPGFSESQKASIIQGVARSNYSGLLNFRGMNFRMGGFDSYSKIWPFHALVKKPGSEDRFIKYLGGLFRTATLNSNYLTVEELTQMRAAGPQPPFGKIKVDYSAVNTLGDLGRAELAAIERVLGRILPRDQSLATHPGSGQGSQNS